MEDLIIGRRLFTDGTTRAVYQDEGGQYVLDDHAEKVYGVWILMDEVLEAFCRQRHLSGIWRTIERKVITAAPASRVTRSVPGIAA